MKNKLTKTQMRLAVAKDALKQLELEIYKAQKGSYYSPCDFLKGSESGEDQAQKYLKKNIRVCQVCAKGAILLSSVGKFNKLTVDEIARGTCDYNLSLTGIFNKENLDLIESAFEGWSTDSKGKYLKNGEKIKKFFNRYPDSNDRLRVILRNIIRNKGRFVL